jgi:hypothetical protein
MHGSVWVALMRQIPPEQQNQYMLMTRSGVEIAIQSLLRVEPHLVILKGRLAGSQEAGRIFFLPYHNIDFVGSAQPMTDSDFNETFGSLVFPEALPAPPPDTIEVSTTNVQDPAAPARPSSPQGTNPAIRSEVLERFRSNRPTSSLNLPSPVAPSRPSQP